MRCGSSNCAVVVAELLFAIVTPAFSKSDSPDPNRYLNAVREFADNVLKYGRDTYGPKHTPLFVDGVHVRTHEPVKWIASNGDRWILSNLASQQNLFRTLDSLTTITGDPKYRQAAVDAIRYAFDNLRSPNGLLYWGNVTAYDAQKDNVVGRDKPYSHVLKSTLPYYELMWKVNPEATKTLIESFWSAHVKDWTTLNMDRIASFTDVLEEPWKHTYTDGPAFLKSSSGISFFTTGIDLAYAAAILSKLSGDKEPLLWAERLIHRYVRTRHPKTGISYWMYTTPSETVLDSYDTIMRKLVPGTTEFLPSEFPWSVYTNPQYRKTMYGQHMPTPSIPINAQVSDWQSQFLVADVLAEEGDLFKQWALEELTAFGRASYRKEDNTYVPILTDGTNIEGYIVKVTSGMLGPSGAALEPLPLTPSDLWAYAMGYRVTNDTFMWEMARNISKGNEFGDIGATSRDQPQLNRTTNCSNPYALLAFLELHRGADNAEHLYMAKRIGDNVLAKRFNKGYFVANREQVYTKFDAIDSLALLHLHLALVADNIKIPQAYPSLPYFYCSYRGKDWANDNAILYTRTKSADPPLSLLEAASLGDIEEVKARLLQGTDVDAFESTFFKTALHEAAKVGQKEVVELLITEGAQIDAKDGWPGLTPLHYAAEGGHIEVIRLLLAKGADVNAKIIAYVRTTTNTTGDTPLHSAVKASNRDIVELLIAKGAEVNAKNDASQVPLSIAISQNRKDIVELLVAKGAAVPSIHVAAQLGDLARVQAFLESGVDVNAKDNKGYTPLYSAIWSNDANMVGLLASKGADVSYCPEKDYPPLHYAVWYENLDIVKILSDHGAECHVEDADGWTALRYAASAGNRAIVDLFLAKGTDVSGLPMAAGAGDLARVEELVKEGADVNAQDKLGWTPLYWATSMDQTGVATFLIAHGAEVQAQAEDGSTPLHQAAQAGDRELVALILSKGADVNIKTKQGGTALHNAAWAGRGTVAELLIAKGAEIDARTTTDRTPLHNAILGNHKAMVKLLLEVGADATVKDRQGRTPLIWAEQRGYTEIADLLRQHGVKE